MTTSHRTMIRDLLLRQRKGMIKSRGIPPRLSDLLKGRFPPCITPPSWVQLDELYFVRYDRRNSGASRGIRTLDTWFRRPVLYPLSYRRLTSVIIAYGKKIRKGKRCLAFARQEDTNQIPLSSSAGSFKTIFLQILSGCASGRT